MKKIVLIAALLSPFAFHQSPCQAQTVVSDDFSRLQVSYKTGDLERHLVSENGIYNLLTLPGYTSGGEVGAPTLPLRNDVIEIPFCDDIRVTVANAVYDTIQFSKYVVVAPLQPSRSKSDTTKHKILFNDDLYATDAFYGLPLASVEVMGVARDRRLALLRFSPVQVNPVTNTVVVCRSADVTVEYVNADVDRSLDHYQRYHTPAFSVGATLNSLYADAKSVSAPIRMVIAVPNALRGDAIEQFAAWKRRQGMMVDLLYYQDLGISTNTALASHLAGLYNNATPEAPAPTFLLLVGDHNQLPAFDSKLPDAGYWSSDPDNDHITDLYFATWTDGDILPDCYQGRFSATSTSALAAIVEKTLLYEQYNFEDDSYLGRAALISGEDNASHSTSGWSIDQAWIYCDPTVDYIAYNYINGANGYNDITLYKNDTNYAPTGVTVTGYCSASNATNTLLGIYNTGIGWINYTAHGDWDRWHQPTFKVSNVSSMTNNGKPSIMIGNCCLSNKFNKPECFGEALLRKGNNAGAVAYIGGTNSTYWTEDFYWSVGIRNDINHRTSPLYSSAHLGIYDRLFHTHGEDFAIQAATMGSIVYFGNFSVNSSSSSSAQKQYYWEIYELMGDPSLLPWMGTAQTLNPYVFFTQGQASVEVHTLPNAYVALVAADGTLLGAAFATDGTVSFPVSSADAARDATVAITLQGYRPCFVSCATLGIDNSLNASLQVYPNPATDHLTIDGLPQGSMIELFDAQGRLVLSHSAAPSLDVSTLASGLYLLRVHTADAVATKKIVIK